jgi:cation diffusion facilitator family transporter
MSSSGSTRAIIAAFAANLGIAIAKFIGFVFTGSASMLAESIHSLADTGNQGLLLLGGKRAAKPPTPQHPFGFGRERYFWAFVVALVLFSLGALFAIGEGIDKILHPHELESVGWAIGILVVSIGLETYSFRTARREADHDRRGASWTGYIRRAKAPELPVVLLEDTGALIGLLLALGAIGMAELTGDARWDGIGTLCIGLLLAVIAVILAVEMKSLLIGESATPADVARITEAIEATPSVQRIIHLRTQHLGPDELLVGAKVEFTPGLTLPELAAAVDAIEANVRAVVPIARPFYIEPDLYRGDPAAS